MMMMSQGKIAVYSAATRSPREHFFVTKKSIKNNVIVNVGIIP